MNIKYENKIYKNTTELNLYIKDKDKKEKQNLINIKLENEYSNRAFIKLIRFIIIEAKKIDALNLSISWQQIKDIKIKNNKDYLYDDIWKAKVLTENLILSDYVFDKYKSKKSNTIENIFIYDNISNLEREEMRIGEIIANSTNIARDLSNTPSNDMTPTILANKAKSIFKNTKVKIKIIEEAEAKKLKMGLFLAVGQGSKEDSKFIICEYMNGNKNERPIVLIGKGITFDTGGLNLKLSAMEEMIMDMSGGATVLSALKAIVDLKIKKNIIAIVPAVENAISGYAYKPGDIITSMSGITVEIGNTDAEGRLVLADAISYSAKYNPRIIIDVATLTGACLVALGQHATGLMTNDNNLEKIIMKESEMTGELVWPLPLWDEYRSYLKSDNADINNISKGRYGGSITAGIFLKTFIENIKDVSWAHLDMAPRMTSVEGDNLNKGSTGEPTKLLIEVIRAI